MSIPSCLIERLQIIATEITRTSTVNASTIVERTRDPLATLLGWTRPTPAIIGAADATRRAIGGIANAVDIEWSKSRALASLADLERVLDGAELDETAKMLRLD